MSKKTAQKQKKDAQETGWPLGAAKRKDSGENGFDRFSRAVHGTLVRLLSNLRLSLTLRIALHFSGQLLRTTLPVLAAAMLALCVAQWPAVSRSLDALAAMTPAQDGVYAQEQLAALPFTEAYLLPQAYEGGLAGLAQRLALLLSDVEKDGQRRVMLYVDTVDGGVAAAWPVDDLLYQMSILFWVLVCLDLYRVGYFLTHRDRLNHRVQAHHRHGRDRRSPQRQQLERPHQRGGCEERAQGPGAGHQRHAGPHRTQLQQPEAVRQRRLS